MRKGHLEEVKECLSDLEEIKEGLSEYFRLRPWGDQGDTFWVGTFHKFVQNTQFLLDFSHLAVLGSMGKGVRGIG